MSIAPKHAYVFARLLANLDVNGEVGTLPDDLVDAAEILRDTPPQDRQTTWDLIHKTHPRGRELVLAVANVDPNGSPPADEDGSREDRPKPQRARKGATRPGQSGENQSDQAERPVIEITADRHVVYEATLKVLRNDPDLYRRGDILSIVTIEEEDEITVHGVRLRGMQGEPRIVPLTETTLATRLTRLAVFVKFDARSDALVPTHPPDWLARTIIQGMRFPGVRRLEGVSTAPIVREDGTICDRPGFDPVTRTIYRPTCSIPPIPDRPTQEDARAAAARLLDLVCDFPFASEDDKAVFLAALLTPIARPAIGGPVPGIALNGNRAGTGKGRLVDTIAIIAHGKITPTTSYPDDPTEATKVAVALALEGVGIVHFDNLHEGSTYGNSAMDSAITSLSIRGRILGQSRTTGDLPIRPCWFLSGNNIAPGSDAYRRWLIGNLVTGEERPEERDDFRIADLLGHVREHRGQLVRDALTILRAYAIAGRPRGPWKGRMGSFEQWDSIVRGATWFATERDCCATRRKAADESPERAAKIALLAGWHEMPGGRLGQTVAQALQALEDDAKQNEPQYETLRSALMEMSSKGTFPTPRQIGDAFRAMQNANHGGYILKRGKDLRKVATWYVVEAAKAESAKASGGQGGQGGSVRTGMAKLSENPELTIYKSSSGATPRDLSDPHSGDSMDGQSEVLDSGGQGSERGRPCH